MLSYSSGIVASIIRTIVFSTTDPIKDVTYTHVELVNWTIIEPGLYLLAACALSFKPLFRMVAKALHLDAIITHSRSAIGRHTSKSNHTAKSHVDIHLETMKSAQSGGFTKLHAGLDRPDEDALVKDVGGMIMVTTTLEMDVESRRESDEYELRDCAGHQGDVDKAV